MTALFPELQEQVKSDLASALACAWSQLEAAVQDGSDPFHTPVIATEGAYGPEARSVVLRSAKQGARELVFYTDARSPKLKWIRSAPKITWLFYDPVRKLQIRARAVCRVHVGDDVARAAWDSLRLSSRRTYLSTQAPGSWSDEPTSGLPAGLDLRVPSLEESESGFNNFAVVVTNVVEFEWLHLAANGHGRARYWWNGEELKGNWIVP
ncbi:MAG TPA: hypothetical protein VE621_14875 [Bryobacteraceae bacterium]|jgi:3-hydroxyisobutyrate dehydrogenase|nr:hypothetical protein [Bryobacteraceae bacterium]